MGVEEVRLGHSQGPEADYNLNKQIEAEDQEHLQGDRAFVLHVG